MRCWCEELVVEGDDEALRRALKEHVDAQHPDEPRTDDEIAERVAAEASEPPDKPPWAY